METDARLCDVLTTGSEVEVDMEKDILTDLASGKSYKLNSLGDVSSFVQVYLLFDYDFEYVNIPCCLCAAILIVLTVCKPLQAGPVIDAGGLFDFARSTGMIKSAA